MAIAFGFAEPSSCLIGEVKLYGVSQPLLIGKLHVHKDVHVFVDILIGIVNEQLDIIVGRGVWQRYFKRELIVVCPLSG